MTADRVVGSLAVEPSQVSDLLRHWSGPADRSPKRQMAAVPFMKLSPKGILHHGAKPRFVNRKAILRLEEINNGFPIHGVATVAIATLGWQLVIVGVRCLMHNRLVVASRMT